MTKRYYTLKPQMTPLPSTTADKGVSRCVEAGKGGAPGRATDDEPTANDPFIRAEAEDDDGYDPYSDRPPAPEEAFQEDPWR